MKKKIVFIASSPHSGSTLLELILCAHSEFIGLGEVFQLIDPMSNIMRELNENRCACGKMIDRCPFWIKAIREIENQPYLSLEEKYVILLDMAENVFGHGKFIVDSSKHPKALKIIQSVDDIHIYVIHLVKDVRAYAISWADRYRKSREYTLKNLIIKKGWKGILRYCKRNVMYSFHDWYWINKKIDNLIESNKFDSIRISYEELCFNLESIVQNICKFLDINYEESMLSIISSKSHNIGGNRMRLDSEKRKKIIYDYRWFYKNDWILPSLIFPYIMLYNNAITYEKKGKKLFEN
jgi:hypothetical protein